MPVKIKKLHRRKRSKAELAHNPSGHGKGRWHNKKTLWASRMARRKRNAVASASRARNRRNA